MSLPGVFILMRVLAEDVLYLIPVSASRIVPGRNNIPVVNKIPWGWRFLHGFC
jgi:hypothetical protein